MVSVGYYYIDRYSDNKIDLINFLKDTLPDKTERDYLLTYLSTGLAGNQLGLFTILNGKTGQNGKSSLTRLLKNTLGDYYMGIYGGMFTSPCPNTKKPHPGLLDLVNRRIIVASEPP